MFVSGTVIKTAMNKRGFKHRRSDDQFSLCSEYARNTQFVYSKEYKSRRGLVVDLIYFSVDILSEKMVIGLYRENPESKNGVYMNTSRAMSLQQFNDVEIAKVLDKLIPPGIDRI